MQLKAKIKLQEIWKSLNVNNYPLIVAQQEIRADTTNPRACSSGRLIEIGRKTLNTKTYFGTINYNIK